MSLMNKLAADGVTVASPRAIEYGLCLNEADRDLTYFIVKKKYPCPGDMLMHNPFFREKRKKKKKKRGTSKKSKSPGKKKNK